LRLVRPVIRASTFDYSSVGKVEAGKGLPLRERFRLVRPGETENWSLL
jgi:hypothetical protein